MWRPAALALAFCASANAAAAQRVLVTAGEHANFTRVVVETPPDVGWILTPEGDVRILTLDSPSARFDTSRLFLRIPRSRLATATANGADLVLGLACDCPVRAWQDRPGLIVMDISDAPAQPVPNAETPSASAPIMPQIDAVATARSAGHALALARPLPLPVDDPALETEADPRLAHLAENLGRGVAQALGQGLLTPSTNSPSATAHVVLDGSPMPDLAENMRILTSLDRPDPEALPTAATVNPEHCQGADFLDVLLDRPIESFADAYGRISRSLYAEFDQPDPDARRDLIALYLASGFGAEARAILVNNPEPVAGRDVALGMSDLLENRSSNSRMRLAMTIDCGGVAALMAVVAGANPDQVRDHEREIALTFSRLPGGLRAVVGAELVRLLVEAGAVDAARIVADSRRHSPWSDADDDALIDAQLDRARGHARDALARLDHAAPSATTGVQARLDMAIETHRDLDDGDLAAAEALAASERNGPAGPTMMASIIRLHARAGDHDLAFAALDRLARWMADTGENHRLSSELRNQIWRSAALDAGDLSFVALILGREDWRNPDMSSEVRLELALRLLELGLAAPVAELLDADASNAATILRARASFALGHAQQALDMLHRLDTPESRRLRAEIMTQIGNPAGAIPEFQQIGRASEAAHAAVLAGDWRTLEGLSADDPSLASDTATLGRLLGRAPGHVEIALRSDQRQEPDQGLNDGDGHEQPPILSLHAAPVSADAPDDPLRPEPTTPQPPRPAPPDAGRTPDVGRAPQSARGRDAPPTSQGNDPLIGVRDPATVFGRLGLVSRSSTLLAESERLRSAIAPLIAPPGL